MPRNRYQKNPFQGPIQQPKPSSSSSDVGREAARQMRERTSRNTRYVDKPEATTNKDLLRQAQTRQQAASRSVQRQVFGEQGTRPLKPSGSYKAPSIPTPPSSPIKFNGAAARLNPAFFNVGAAAWALSDPTPLIQASQAAVDFLQERGLAYDPSKDPRVNPALGNRPIVNPEELAPDSSGARDRELRFAQYAEMGNPTPIPQGTQSAAPAQQVAAPAPVSAPVEDPRNAEYNRRRLALGENPTKEEMDAVRDFGLAQHRENFPQLYKP